MSSRVVQITDLHLFTDPAGELRGINTRDSLARVMALIAGQHPDFDCLVITGDIAQDEAQATYQILRDLLGDWLDRTRLIPGNHDNRDFLRSAFPEHFDPASETLGFIHHLGGWKLVGVDSQVPGETHGHVNGAQLEWLHRELSGADEPTLAFIHHPPVPIEVEWLDQISFDTPEPLLEAFGSAPGLKAVSAGHVHQERAGHIGALPFLTTPSTCVQFGETRGARFDVNRAGYRTFELHDDTFETCVWRLDGTHTEA